MSERWKPKRGDRYWVIDSSYKKEVRSLRWDNDQIDNLAYKYGNCFKTEAEAKAASEKVKELLLGMHEQTTNISQPVTECNQWPKLTVEVFDREDCPEWAKYAAVDMSGIAHYFDERPYLMETFFYNNRAHHWMVDGDFDASDWKNSLIERPANGLPDWCKVGEWVYYEPRSVYCKIEQMCDGFMLRFLNGDSTAIPRCDVKTLKQARFRPYNAHEMEALVGKAVKTPDGNVYICTAYQKPNDAYEAVVDVDSWISAAGLLEDGYTINGKPCGKLEHLNEKGEWVE